MTACDRADRELGRHDPASRVDLVLLARAPSHVPLHRHLAASVPSTSRGWRERPPPSPSIARKRLLSSPRSIGHDWVYSACQPGGSQLGRDRPDQASRRRRVALHTWLEPGQEALAAAKLRGAPVSRCQSSNAKHAAWVGYVHRTVEARDLLHPRYGEGRAFAHHDLVLRTPNTRALDRRGRGEEPGDSAGDRQGRHSDEGFSSAFGSRFRLYGRTRTQPQLARPSTSVLGGHSTTSGRILVRAGGRLAARCAGPGVPDVRHRCARALFRGVSRKGKAAVMAVRPRRRHALLTELGRIAQPRSDSGGGLQWNEADVSRLVDAAFLLAEVRPSTKAGVAMMRNLRRSPPGTAPQAEPVAHVDPSSS